MLSFAEFRIDLLAKEPCSGRDVIVELKLGAGNPTTQLVRYAKYFSDPILIGVTEKHVVGKRVHSDIQYFTYSELNKKAIANITSRFGGAEDPMANFQQRYSQTMQEITQALA